MSKIIALLSGGSGIWIMIGALLAASVAGGAAGYGARGIVDAPALAKQEALTARAETATAQCHAAGATARADANAAVVKGLSDSITQLKSLNAELADKLRLRDLNNQTFLRNLADAPKTSVCGGSAAERAYRSSVQD